MPAPGSGSFVATVAIFQQYQKIAKGRFKVKTDSPETGKSGGMTPALGNLADKLSKYKNKTALILCTVCNFTLHFLSLLCS
jgi:hypothetical protein